MSDSESKAWFDELKEEYKVPDANLRECCLAIAFGGLERLRADVHKGNFHGSYELIINFCPHCGKDMIKYRAIVEQKFKVAMIEELNDINGTNV